ncbi:MAG: HlyD family type I secretion periplasmic adaptor subunit, partial [Magnetococcales bacterium]|nr:HlyD family type I secretion periplasmic adaptor subunit [Magnetococcales bacterium]
YLSARAAESRMMASQSGADQITFHADLLAEANDPVVKELMAQQERELLVRRAARKSEKAIIHEGIHVLEQQIKTTRATLQGRQQQLSLVQKQLVGTREMFAEGYLSRNTLYAEERVEADLVGQIASLQSSMAQTAIQIGERRLQLETMDRQDRRQLEMDLTAIRNTIEIISASYESTKIELERMIIRAPTSGFVQGLSVQTVGAVIGPSAKIMDIIPEDERLLLEAQLPLHMVDRVYPGQDVDVRLDAFIDLPNLVIAGRVVSVSADQISLGKDSYYLMRVEVLPEGYRDLGYRKMRPGMPATVMVKTGERTLFNYLLRPITRRMAMSLTER